MARTTINSLGVPAGTITASDLTFPLADFSSTGIDDNASTTSLTIDSSGNISVTGTVDGRDLATDGTKLDNIEANADVTDTTNVTAAGALMDSELTDLAGVKGVTISTLQPKPSEGAFADGDKTKLDGIESGATADQTASEILTAIKTVDGTGSGLDADTLDGQEGTYYLNYNNFTNTPTIPTNNNQLTNGAGYLTSFDITTQTDPKYLRSNAADTATGTITISGLDQSLISQYNVNGNFWSGRIISSNTTTGVASFLGNYNGYAGVFAHNSALNAWAPIYINTLSTGNGAANVYLGTTYINGNTAWHAGNDGSGSGLDADTLDGQQGSYYQPASTAITTANIGSQSVSSASNIDGIGFTNTGSNSGTNADTIDSNGISYYTSGVTNFSGNATDGALYSQRYSSSWQHQIAGDYRSGQIALRGKNSGTWQSWRKVWDTGNDGSGSGLDADTVDGIQGASFLRSDASDTASGQYTFTKVNDHAIRVGTIRGTVVGSQAGEYIHMYERVHIGSPSGWGSRNAPSTGLSTYGGADLATDTGSVTISGNTAWHAGNDGSGSGLDADTLDGVQGTNYFRCDGTYPNTDMNTTVEGYWHVASTASNLPVSYYGHRWDWDHLNNGQWVFQMYSPTSGTDDLWFRQKRNYSAQTWHKVWTTGNDGSGSGLDADTVDGVQASSIMQLSSTQTITGVNYFNGNRNTTSSNPPLQAYGTTSGAIMSFHRGGYFAVNFGLDSDNVMRIGGWSAAANRWQLDMSGNMTVAGNVTAYSDIRLKENIKVIPNALEKVKQLRGVTFTRNDQEDKEARHTGVIAQEVEIVLPEVVAEDNDGVKNVAYGNMVGLLIEAIKEQQAQIEEQQAQIEELKEIIKCQ